MPDMDPVHYNTLVVLHLTSTPRPQRGLAGTPARAWRAPMKGSDRWGSAWGSPLPSECIPGTGPTSGTEGRCSPPSRPGSLSEPGANKQPSHIRACGKLNEA